MDNKIFVGGLNYEIDEARLKEIFQNYGKIINLRIVRNHIDKTSRGFGFVTFESSESAQKALELDNELIDGRLIGVKIAVTRQRE